jgi:DNA replication protein DnaC
MKKRKTPSIYGKYFSRTFLKVQTWLQSEKLPSYLPFFVRKDLLISLESNSNHLVIGRRGTGKTHLFGAFK